MALTRPQQLAELLGLTNHPEGGKYRQIYRSEISVQPADSRSARRALTSIYYLLAAGEFSRWHRVRSDEVWHLYEGGPLELLVAPPDLSRVDRRVLDTASADHEPVTTVPADWWQAARPLGEYALCGCTVAPGFEFEDFGFMRGNDDARNALRRLEPAYDDLV
jgi:predicted cupin superfamily sugar epimerase